MVVNVLMALLCAWTARALDVSMTPEVIFHVVMALFSYGFTLVWQYWIDNPEKYEKLQQARLRRFIGGVGKPRRKRKDKEKKTED